MKKIIVIFLLSFTIQINHSQEIIDQVVAIVGENPILYSDRKSVV